MYKINETKIIDSEGKEISSYGITFENVEIKDISINKDIIVKLIEKCNKFNVSKLHMYDIVEDFLVDFEI